MTDLILSCLLFGGFAGVLSGLFGIGGGIVLVPFLVWLFQAHDMPERIIMVMAVSTSLATIILTACASALAHYRLGSLNVQLLYRFIPGLVAGTLIGSWLADSLESTTLKLIFAGYLFISSIQIAFNMTPQGKTPKLPGNFLLGSAATVIGSLSAMLGIGGGTLTVPYLLHYKVPLTQAIGVSSACGIPIAIFGTISFALLGHQVTDKPELSLGYIYLPAFFSIILTSPFGAQLGARLAHRLPTLLIKRIFAVIMLVVGIKLLW